MGAPIKSFRIVHILAAMQHLPCIREVRGLSFTDTAVVTTENLTAFLSPAKMKARTIS
jgi:hypothetical protein